MDFCLVRLVLILLLFPGEVLFAQTDEILFIGNSFTFGGASRVVHDHGGVPGLVEALARSQGKSLGTSMRAISGYDWSDHLSNPATGKALRALKWTWVVLQDLSTRPTHVGDVRGFLQDGEELSRRIARNSPGTGILLFETWARQPGVFYHRHPGNSFTGPGQMTNELHQAYGLLKDDLMVQNRNRDVRIARIGTAFARIAADYPEIRLEAPDHHHATTEGYYLAALVIDETIYGQSVLGVPSGFFHGALTIPAEDAPRLQKVADEVSAAPSRNE